MGCSGLRCTNRDSIAIFPQVSWEFGCVSPPTDFTLSLQKLGCISPPTDFTDLHRWLGCVCSPTEFTEFTEVRLRKSSHRFHGFAQMVGCVCSPTEFTEFTEVLGCCWLRGYGRMPYPPNLCASVPICGRYFSARNFCAFRGFCGNIVSHGFHRSTQMVGCVNSPTEFTEFTEVWGCCWLRGYGRMPYPPTSV